MFSSPQTPKKKVMVFGTFDILHAGHENFLEQAGKLGDYVIAVISRDETVKKVKGFYTLNNESRRLKNVRKSGFVDKAILGNHGDKYEVIKKYKPDIIALGYDQYAFTQRLEKFLIDTHMNTVIYRLDSYQPKIYKTSLLKQKTSILASNAPA